ncbi:InlB B-repeat-containing protein, partial [Methanoregula sp.]|uniref:InlB B-repeat-containing protein n=1 Tax=Methanoregula sp. TaxID=2052170 RepID=UPI003C3A6C12
MTLTDAQVAALDVNTIQLPQLHFDNSQAKVIVNAELNPVETTQSTQVTSMAVSSQSTSGSTAPVGAIIYHSQGGVTSVFDSNGNQLFATNDATAALVATPNGEAPATFVHEIPSGSIVKYGTNGTFVFYNSQLILTLVNEGGSNLVNENSIAVPSAVSVPVSSCGNLNGNNYIGWIEDAETSASAPTSLTRFEATWKAPEQTPNTTESQAGPLAIFNGIQNASTGVTDGIMQPVLSWDYIPKDFPTTPRLYYTGAAWDFHTPNSGEDSLHSTPISVSPGDTVRGTMEWSPYLKTWIIQFSDINNGRTTEFHSNRFTTTNLQLFMAVEASQQGVIINPTPTVPSLNNGLTGSISFNNIIIQNNGQSVPVIFSPDICSLATQHFNSLNVVINPTPLSVSLITQPISYTITATANFNGAISPSGSVIVVDGASQTFTITANQWYVIDDVEVDGTSVGGSDLQTFSYTIPDVTEDHMIHASFKRAQIYTITPNAGSGGSITPSTTVRVRQGQSQTFTITPDTGYAIEDVQIDAGTPNAIDAGATSSYTF